MSERRVTRCRKHQAAPAEAQIGELVALAAAFPEDVLAHDAALAGTHLHVHGNVGRTDLHENIVAFTNAQLTVEPCRVEARDPGLLQERAGAVEERPARQRDAQTAHATGSASAVSAASVVPC